LGQKILAIGASVLLVIIKLLLFAKKIAAIFFVYFIYKPVRLILRFIFYKVVVKIYCFYLSLIKKIGWSNLGRDYFHIFFHQKLVHIIVIVITLLLIFTNLAPKTKAGGWADKSRQTILASLIKSEFGDLEEDEQFIIESFDKETTISVLQQTYLDNLASFKVQPKVKMEGMAEEEERDEVMPTIQGGTTIVKPDITSTKITKRLRTKIITYIVESGDSVSTIAEKFEISVSTILWENNLSAYSIIRPGDKLTILPISGVTHKVVKGENLSSIAKKYKVAEEKILTANKLASEVILGVGQKLIIPGGKKRTYAPYTSIRYTGFSAIRDIVQAPDAKPVAGNKMNWPTVGRRITQYYSWRHHAVDIANKTGTPIYAADAGLVEYIGWGKGYGNQIVIDHGGGKKTRYAHLSKFYVKKGQRVSKGETIGAMGSTGWSTGPHVHFEVIINGQKYNPLNYIK